ncbi:MAG: hypothetical protein ACR2L2_11430 [Acidobacteriota bacterium]
MFTGNGDATRDEEHAALGGAADVSAVPGRVRVIDDVHEHVHERVHEHDHVNENDHVNVHNHVLTPDP